MIGSASSLLIACAPKIPDSNPAAGIPRQVFDGVAPYAGPVNSVGTLTQAYIRNTEGLLTTNSRLKTLCIAFEQCEQDQE